MFKKFITWASGFLSDKGEGSSKRFVGVGSGIVLWVGFLKTSSPSEPLILAIAGFGAAALGFTSLQYIKGSNSQKDSEIKPE